MDVRIKVKNMTLDQWDYLRTNVPVNHQFQPGEVRTLVEFELDPELNTFQVELPVADLAGLLTVLHGMDVRDAARAILTPDEIPGHLETVRNGADPVRAAERTCDHGAAVTAETPSAFDGAEPVRDYADGCQSFGPYRNSPEQVTEKLTGNRPSWADS